jgi:hypothetical protein
LRSARAGRPVGPRRISVPGHGFSLFRPVFLVSLVFSFFLGFGWFFGLLLFFILFFVFPLYFFVFKI